MNMKVLLEWLLTSEASIQIPSPAIKGPPLLLLVYLGLLIVSLVWIVKDAQKRGRSAGLAALFLILGGWPISLLWWLWLRPASTKLIPPPLPAQTAT